MAHRIYPILGGLALGLALFAPPTAAAAGSGNAPEYSGLAAGGLASRDVAAGEVRLRTAQAGAPPDDGAGSEARKNLRSELDAIRRKAANETGSPSFDPPLPVRKRDGQTAPSSAEAAGRQQDQSDRAAEPQIDRLSGRVLLLNFKGTQPSEPGPRAIRALLQAGGIAGAVFSRENIQSKAQIKELMKFFWAGSQQSRPLFAVREIGGVSDALPPIKDFEQWPSERDVATKGDPQYAYSTYRSMGANLAVLGFNLNFGPVLAQAGEGRDPAASFGGNPLQAGVFAKTFILGHSEEKVIAVPILDGSDLSVRTLKTLLVADPGIPVSSALSMSSGMAPFAAYGSLVRGPRFCFAAVTVATSGPGAVSGLRRGCDVLVFDGGTENPAAVRDQVALGLSEAIHNGELTSDALNAAAQRLAALRSPPQH